MNTKNQITVAFKEIVNSYPKEIAIETKHEKIDYLDLDKKSEKIASYIKNYYEATKLEKLSSSKLIGIYTDRSSDLIYSILAILKLDCIYVPINPTFPDARVEYIIEHAELDLIICQSHLQPKLNRVTRRLANEIIVIDVDDDMIVSWPIVPESREEVSNSPTHVYLLYTSGSTGNPKGILVGINGFIDVIKFKQKNFFIGPGSKILGFAHSSFDASAWEIFGALLSGATYCVAAENELIPGKDLVSTIEQFNITHITLPPTALSRTEPENLKSLKYIISAGEPLSYSIMNKWLSTKWKFYNAYGPTEATICAMYAECNSDDTYVHLGKPVNGTVTLLVDENGNPVGKGQVGELVVAYVDPENQYYKNEALTREKFKKLKDDDTCNCYFTGDLAIMNHDSKVEYVGRKDHQVKIRGYRIELGEIEHAILKLPKIGQAVAAIKDFGDNKALVLYYCLMNNSDHIDEKELQTLLLAHLPSYMLPQFFVKVDHFQLSSNDKIDRAKLPDLQQPLMLTEDKVELTDSAEVVLSNIWKEVLGKSIIHDTDNFFDIGGHSLLVTQIIILINQRLSVMISMLEFMANPQFESLLGIVKSKLAIVSADSKTHNEEVKNSLPSLNISQNERFLPFPLTEIQQSYYLGRSDTYELSHVSTNIYREFIFKEFDLVKLELALNKLIERHEMLRCVFISSDQQQICRLVPVYKIKTHKLSIDNAALINRHLETIRSEMSYKKLPADQFPLFEVQATILNNATHLHFVIDALIVDGWSYYIFFNELERLYFGDEDLKPLTLSFRDYVIYEQSIKNSALYKKHESYWKARLNDFPVGPALPLQKKPNEITNSKSSTLRMIIDSSEWLVLTEMANKLDISKTLLLLAVFSEVLYHWSGNNRFIINLTLFNRMPVHPNVNDIIGDFTALELLEIDFSSRSNITFIDHIYKIKERLYADLDHRLFSGVALQRAIAQQLGQALESSLMPIVFTSFLDNDKKPKARNSIDNLFTFNNLVYGVTQSSQVWLDYKAYEENGKLIIEWDYIDELFPPNLIKSMFNSYVSILKELRSSENYWRKTSLISSFGEVRSFCKGLENNPYSLECLTSYVLRSVAQYPNNTAVIGPEQQLSYHELHDFSLRLAGMLKNTVDIKNSFVAVCLEKCPQQIVAVMGILYAGYAYVPIDPGLPVQRINRLLQDANIRAIITSGSFLDKIKAVDYTNELAKDSILLVDNLNDLPLPSSQEIVFNKGSDLAYVIYTSGSTGIPKGVMLEHQSVINTILDINERFEVGEKDKIFALSNLNFDLSVYDIFGMLFSGGSIVIPDNDKLKDPLHWLEEIEKYKVTIWNSVPMFMQMFVEYLNGKHLTGMLNSLRLFLLSGDWIPLSLPVQIRQICSESERCQIISLGGATECAIWSVLYEIGHVEEHWNSIPYGYSMRNQAIYVLNENLDICPDWVQGELYIAGNGLARGYLNDESKTKKQFIYHPDTGQRLYRTGDFGRFHPDAYIEFLGRKDTQIKISGHRIELAEIDHCLLQHPAVQSSITEIVQDKSKQPRLVSFLQPINRQNEFITKIDGVVSDLAEKNNFKNRKLNRRQLRGTASIKIQIDDEEEVIAEHWKIKSYRQFEQDEINDDQFREFLAKIVPVYPFHRSVDLKLQLCYVLNSLKAVFNSSEEEPKYRYASAGGLYPVQIYLTIHNNNDVSDHWQPGNYYFDPIDSELKLISRIENIGIEAEFSYELFLIAYLPAIMPIYGRLSEKFAFLEGGYISSLLHQGGIIQSTEQYLKVEQNMEAIKHDFALNADYLPILGIRSINIHDSPFGLNINNLVSVYFYIKPDKFGFLIEGIYYFNFSTQTVELITSDLTVSETDFSNYNATIFQDASLVMFILSDDYTIKNEALIMAGNIAHHLMSNVDETRIGLCPIGEFSDEFLQALFKIIGKKSILHVLVGGVVSEEQVKEKNSSYPRLKYSLEPIFIQKFLRDRLPQYMVPEVFCQLSDFPLTENGKIDHKVLRELADVQLCNYTQSNVGPSNQLEIRIFNLWKELLPLNAFSVHDHFVRLGGNSLLFVRLKNLILNEFGVEKKLADLMNNPTIAKMAKLLEADMQTTKPDKFLTVI